MAGHQTGDKLVCPECSNIFTRLASLKCHLAIHEEEDNLTCGQCGEEFPTDQQIKKHKEAKHGQNGQKNTVEEKTDDFSKILQPFLEESRKEPKKSLICKTCGQVSQDTKGYKEHQLQHKKLKSSLELIKKRPKEIIRDGFKHICRYCWKKFRKPSQLVRHERIHTGEKPFICSECGKGFNQKQSLDCHSLKHSGQRPFACSFCSMKFCQRGNLRSHILRVHNMESEGGERAQCQHCTCSFKKPGSLHAHVSRFHPDVSKDDEITLEMEEQEEQNTDLLSRAFQSVLSGQMVLADRTSNGKLRKHLVKTRLLDGVRFYLCNFCSKQFRKPSDLIRHVRIHTQERPFKCNQCSRTFALKSTLLSHLKIHQNISSRQQPPCDQCGKVFHSRIALRAHMKQHDNPVQCDQCEDKFLTNGSLNDHKLSVHKEHRKPFIRKDRAEEMAEPLVITEQGLLQSAPRFSAVYNPTEGEQKERPFKCETCSASFKKSSHLVQHMRGHTGERPFVCYKCSKQFISRSSLNTHLQTHEGSRMFQCGQCGMVFSSAGSVRRHMAVHQEERPFMCPYCQKTFKTNVNCKKHMKTHRGQVSSHNMSGQARAPSFIIETKAGMEGLHSETVVEEEQLGDIQGDSTFTFNHQQTEGVRMYTADETGTITLQSGVEENIVLDRGDDQITTMNIIHTESEQQEVSLSLTNEQENVRSTTTTMAGIKNHTVQNVMPQLFMNVKDTNHTSLIGSLNQQTTSQEHIEINPGAVVSVIEQNEETDINPTQVFILSQVNQNQHIQNETNANITFLDHHNVLIPSLDVVNQELSTLTNQSNQAEISHQSNEQMVGQNGDGFKFLIPNEDIASQKQLQQNISITTKLNETLSKDSVYVRESIIDKTNEKKNSMQFSDFTMDFTKLNSPSQETTSQSQGSELFLNSLMEDQSDKIWRCGNCGLEFQDLGILKSHLKEHKEHMEKAEREVEDTRDRERHKCGQCSDVFATAQELTSHENILHNEKLECELCGEEASDRKELVRHQTNNHGSQQLKCSHPGCGQNFRTVDNLTQHNMTNHGGDPGPSGIRRLRVANHIKLTEEQTRALADTPLELAKTVSEKMLLSSAVEKVKGDMEEDTEEYNKEVYPNQCEQCQMSFKKPSDLVRHVRTHTGEKPYSCQTCERRFTVKSTLKTHMKVHTGGKSLVCHICQSMFASSTSLKVHMRLHTGSLPYKCDHCDQKFRTPSHRRTHVNNHCKLATEAAKTEMVPLTISAESLTAALEAVSNSGAPLIGATVQLQLHGHGFESALTQLHIDEALVTQLRKGENINISISQMQLNQSRTTNKEPSLVSTVLDGDRQIELEDSVPKSNESLLFMDTVRPGELAYNLIENNIGQDQTSLVNVSVEEGGSGNELKSVSLISQEQPISLVSKDQPIKQSSQELSIGLISQVDPISLISDEPISLIRQDQSVSHISQEQTVSKVGQDRSESLISQELTADETSQEIFLTDPNQHMTDNVKRRNQVDINQVYICPWCDQVFSTEQERISHLLSGHGVEVKEDTVPTSNQTADVEQQSPSGHTETDVTTVRDKICSVCEKKFSKPSQLVRHMRVHTGERPFACAVCRKSFNQKNALQIHMKKHTGERPYVCPVCQYTFSQKGNLKTHILRCHGETAQQLMRCGSSLFVNKDEDLPDNGDIMVVEVLETKPDV